MDHDSVKAFGRYGRKARRHRIDALDTANDNPQPGKIAAEGRGHLHGGLRRNQHHLARARSQKSLDRP